MSSLETLAISGVRSYSYQSLQIIEFSKPLTLIWGKNGSGKTTIIEALKYITTGSLPPSCDKGKNFIMDPKIAGVAEVTADIRLKFKTFNNRLVLAKKRAILSNTTKGVKFESLEQILKTRDENGQLIQINHQCAEMEKQIPQILGITKPILQNIVFCHQDESLWPFSDSANLKNIFDELFETKRYTKIMQGFWDQYKEYIKIVKQNKKALEYLERIYEEDKRRKMNALAEMEKLGLQVQKILPMKAQLEVLSKQMQQKSIIDKSSGEKKYTRVSKMGQLTEKINNGNKLMKQFKMKMAQLNQQFKALYDIEIVVDNVDLVTRVKELKSNLDMLAANRDKLKQILEQTKNATIYSQKQMEIISEIKRAKQCMPQLKKESSEQQILKKLQTKSEQLFSKKKQLISLKQERDKMILPSILDLPLSQKSYQEQKTAMSVEYSKLEQIKNKILKIFNKLYKKVQKQSLKKFQSNIEQKLKQVQFKLKMKRQELEKYKEMPSIESLKQKKFKLYFTGVEMYESIYNYCSQKMKCSFCSKPISPDELKSIKHKCDRTISKTKEKIKQMQSNEKEQFQVQIDAEQMVKMLEEQIQKAEGIEKDLIVKFRQYSSFKDQSDQYELNQKLLNNLKRVGLEHESKQVGVISEDVKLEMFVECIVTYEKLTYQQEAKSKDLRLYEQRCKMNKQIIAQKRKLQQKKTILSNKISQIEEETKSYDIIVNVHKRLAVLMKTKGKVNKSSDSCNESSSMEDLGRRIYQIESDIKSKALQKDYIQLLSNYFELQQGNKMNEEQIRKIERQIREIDQSNESKNKKLSEYNTLKAQFQGKKQTIDLKYQMAFQEYHVPFQKEYLIKRERLKNVEIQAKEIQAFCKAIQNTISSIHKQKMDEVNRVLAQIWTDVYHQQDIKSIQIQARDEEDSKKRRSYHYSIVMQKIGAKVEMRGRCSMGQKVLASIVIRLALAEVFSNHTRILALDQPTTNLDRQHINNLAYELGRLIELNQGKYLQLIIISHDIQFIKRLQKYTSCYYEISRDAKKFSIVKKKQIRQLFEQI